MGTYVVGLSANNYYRSTYTNWVINPSISNGTISFESGGASGYGIGFPLILVADQTYCLSGTGNGYAGAIYYDKDGNFISYQISSKIYNSIILNVPSNTMTTVIIFTAAAPNTSYSFTGASS